MQDGDGDLSTTTLTINVNNVSVTASDTEALVNEAGLPSGSDSGASSEAFNGAITPAGGTGPTCLSLTSNGNGTYGNLVLNADGTHTYTLDTTYHGAANNNGVTTEPNVEGLQLHGYRCQRQHHHRHHQRQHHRRRADGACGHRQRDRRCGHERQRADRCWHDQRCGRCRHGGCGRLPVLPQVVGVAAGNNTSSPVSGGVGTVSGIAGSYGTLYLNADGTYTYDANPNAVTSNQTDTFIYTVQDGDGDLSTTTLTINVNNVSVTASDTEALVSKPACRAAATPGLAAKPSTVRSPPAGGTGRHLPR